MIWLWENREGNSNHVFTCPVPPYIGQPYKTAAHVMERLCQRAGVKRFGFHAIRHLAATILAQEGHTFSASSTACAMKNRARLSIICMVLALSRKLKTRSAHWPGVIPEISILSRIHQQLKFAGRRHNLAKEKRLLKLYSEAFFSEN